MSPLAFSLRLLQAQPDERLLSLASAGHEPAFEALVRRYRRPLLAYCRRLTGPDTSAEDVLQQALLQAWRALDAGIQVRDARAWLYRIVHNVAISTVRGGAETPAELGSTVRATGVEQLVEQRLAAREALAGLAALPALQREVMLETALEGRSHEEVATALGLSHGSVRGLIYRARATLRAAAAALIPGPLLGWAARQDHAPGAGSAALAGGGSAGIAGAVLKGGAIVTAVGAIAGTAVVAVHHSHHPATAAQRTGHRITARAPVITAAVWSASVDAARAAADTTAAGGSGASGATRHGTAVALGDHRASGGSGTQRTDVTRSIGSGSHRGEPGDSTRTGDTGRQHQGGTDSSGGAHHDGSGTNQTPASAAADDESGGGGSDVGDGGSATAGTDSGSSGGTQTTTGTQTSTTSTTSAATPAATTTQPSSAPGTSTTTTAGE